MKANELRIGNLVFNDKCLTVVTNLLSDGVCTLKTKQGNFIRARYELLEPIPLIELWLIKLGFFKNNNAWVLKKPTNVFEFSIWEDLTYNTGELMPPLDYIHQLQNLYFALTGEELELKNL